ncbi:MAG: hypothetical protein ACOZCL_19150 [Bacillota bacterium]
MANPLMKTMLNNILVKEGRKIPDQTVNIKNTAYGSPVHLKEEQQSFLILNVLKDKNRTADGYKTTYSNSNRGMVTLDSLRLKKNK